MTELRLRVRTPLGLVVDGPVTSVVAEDVSGWFGIRPGREDVVALLPPGLLVYRDAAGEGFVALSQGLLHLRRGECRVTASEAVASRDLGALASKLDLHLARRRAGAAAQRGVLHDLAREAVRRLAAETRT